MEQKRLNNYRKLRAIIKRNNGYLEAASKYLYTDPRFPDTIAELSKTTHDLEEYCKETYADVTAFVAASVLQDPETGRAMEAYYHEALDWKEMPGQISEEKAKELVSSYINS